MRMSHRRNNNKEKKNCMTNNLRIEIPFRVKCKQTEHAIQFVSNCCLLATHILSERFDFNLL